MPRKFGFAGVLILGAGLAGVFVEDSNHNACNSHLGTFGQPIGAHCGLENAIFYIGILAAVVGLFLIVGSILFRS
ncbi:MAG TPA: hypothetical protein VMR97_02325 [Acidimicrobiales bacterium]|nr:hypothetical protein [Acidimicrobiales bacterium]